MHRNWLKNALLIGVSGLMLMTTAHAGMPVWTFAPVAGYPPAVSVSTTGSATVQYSVTNQSSKSHTLQMKPIQGVTSTGCGSPLGYLQSCTLSLNVRGSALAGSVRGGPVLCEQANPNQCFRPSQGNELNITLTPLTTYTVTASGDTHVGVSPVSQTLSSGATTTIAVTPALGYTAAIASDTCGGSLSGTTYTTGVINTNCSVRFSSSLLQFNVSASGDAQVRPSPASQNASYNTVATVALAVTAGYAASIVSDTCGGSLSGTTYTTGAVTRMCSVRFSSSLIRPVVAAGTYTDTNNTARPLLALSQDSGTSWSYPESITAPVFTPNNTIPFVTGYFHAVSCAGATCAGVGFYLDASNISYPLLALSQDSGTSWSYPESITELGFTTNVFSNNANLAGVNCTGTLCIAVGTYTDISNIKRPLLALSQDSGTSWSYPESITAPVFTPSDTYVFTGLGAFAGVSCTGTTCIAVGEYYDPSNIRRPLLAFSQDSGSSWSYPESITAPVFTNYPLGHNGGSFASASCTGTTCIAVGSYNDFSSTQRPLLALSQDSGSSWNYPESIIAPVFTTYPYSNGGVLASASCTGTTCIAAGSYTDTSSTQRPLLALSQDAGSSWSYPESITAPVFTTNPFSTSGSFASASCTGTLCTAVGSYIDANSIQRALLALSQDSGATWIYLESATAPLFTPNNTNPFSNSGSFSGTSTNSLWLPKSLHFLIK